MGHSDSHDGHPITTGARSSPDDDAVGFVRRHAGEHEPDLTATQRALLGRVIARRLAQGAKLEAIARAAAGALPELGADRAGRLARDEALRALAHECLAELRASGATTVAFRPARDACPACRAAAGVYALAAAPKIPVPDCMYAHGCRCLYAAATSGADPDARAGDRMPSGVLEAEPDTTQAKANDRPWYRPRAPRPHGPRWDRDPATGIVIPPAPPPRAPRRGSRPRRKGG